MDRADRQRTERHAIELFGRLVARSDKTTALVAELEAALAPAQRTVSPDQSAAAVAAAERCEERCRRASERADLARAEAAQASPNERDRRLREAELHTRAAAAQMSAAWMFLRLATTADEITRWMRRWSTEHPDTLNRLN